MCNIFSGHIISDKEHKDFGKVLFITGIHHEKDREEIYKKYGPEVKIVAWESEENLSLEKFILTHSVGDITEKEKTEYLKLIKAWGKLQDKSELLKIVAKHGSSLDVRGCDLKGVKLPESISGSLYVSGCDLKGVKLPESIGGWLYVRGCDLKGVKLPKNTKIYK